MDALNIFNIILFFIYLDPGEGVGLKSTLLTGQITHLKDKKVELEIIQCKQSNIVINLPMVTQKSIPSSRSPSIRPSDKSICTQDLFGPDLAS